MQPFIKKCYAPYIFHEPEGRFPNEHLDCVVRALTIASGLSYKDIHDLTSWHGRKSGHATCYVSQLLNSLFPGRNVTPVSGRNGRTWTVGQVIKQYSVGRYVVAIRGHAFALVNGVVHDMSMIGLRTRVEWVWDCNK